MLSFKEVTFFFSFTLMPIVFLPYYNVVTVNVIGPCKWGCSSRFHGIFDKNEWFNPKCVVVNVIVIATRFLLHLLVMQQERTSFLIIGSYGLKALMQHHDDLWTTDGIHVPLIYSIIWQDWYFIVALNRQGLRTECMSDSINIYRQVGIVK